jgi:HSP20 family molecular chaperone IbpA
MKARFKDGVLEVTMPAAAASERERGRRIDVKGG